MFEVSVVHRSPEVMLGKRRGRLCCLASQNTHCCNHSDTKRPITHQLPVWDLKAPAASFICLLWLLLAFFPACQSFWIHLYWYKHNATNKPAHTNRIISNVFHKTPHPQVHHSLFFFINCVLALGWWDAVFMGTHKKFFFCFFATMPLNVGVSTKSELRSRFFFLLLKSFQILPHCISPLYDLHIHFHSLNTA